MLTDWLPICTASVSESDPAYSDTGVTETGVSVGAFQEAEALVAQMTPAEKAQFSRFSSETSVMCSPASRASLVCRAAILHRAHPDPGLGAGAIRRLGMSEAELLTNYPSLRAEDLVNAWAYVRAHREEIDRQIEEQESA